MGTGTGTSWGILILKIISKHWLTTLCKNEFLKKMYKSGQKVNVMLTNDQKYNMAVSQVSL